MGKLTVRTVEGLVKAGTSGMTGDGQGLYFQISKTGGMSWVFPLQGCRPASHDGLGTIPRDKPCRSP